MEREGRRGSGEGEGERKRERDEAMKRGDRGEVEKRQGARMEEKQEG